MISVSGGLTSPGQHHQIPDRPSSKMLYLHCGWPRTATSSFQQALGARRDELAEAGVSYPLEWRGRAGNQRDAHHGLIELLTLEDGSHEPLAKFQNDLRCWDGDVLLSSEALSNWVVPWLRDALVRLLDSAREVTELTTLWTLRRMDELFASMCLHQVLLGSATSPQEFFDHRVEIGWIEGMIRGNAEICALDGLESVHTKYHRNGEHCADLLTNVGVGGALRSRIMDAIRDGPRTGERLTHKGAIALLYLDEISERVGIEIDRRRLVNTLFRGELTFSDDSAFEIVDEGRSRQVHDAALEASRKHGFSPYIDFFADDEVKGSGSPSPVDIGVLTREDVRKVASFGPSVSPDRGLDTLA